MSRKSERHYDRRDELFLTIIEVRPIRATDLGRTWAVFVCFEMRCHEGWGGQGQSRASACTPLSNERCRLLSAEEVYANTRQTDKKGHRRSLRSPQRPIALLYKALPGATQLLAEVFINEWFPSVSSIIRIGYWSNWVANWWAFG